MRYRILPKLTYLFLLNRHPLPDRVPVGQPAYHIDYVGGEQLGRVLLRVERRRRDHCPQQQPQLTTPSRQQLRNGGAAVTTAAARRSEQQFT